MPAYNFQKQFVLLIENGEKRQTIRACRKDGRKTKAGNILYLYTGMRTKGCRKLKEVLCKSVLQIVIDKNHVEIQDGTFMVELNSIQKAALVFKDGFETYTAYPFMDI